MASFGRWKTRVFVALLVMCILAPSSWAQNHEEAEGPLDVQKDGGDGGLVVSIFWDYYMGGIPIAWNRIVGSGLAFVGAWICSRSFS